jgi:RND family efflux transporter MFP subunit
MSQLRRRWAVALALLLVLAAPALWYAKVSAAPDASDGAVVAAAKRGDFRVIVSTTGELRARKFVQIQGPSNAQQAQQFQMKISSIVPEGTVVKEGEVVAELDRSGIAAKMQEVSLNLQKAEAQLTQAQLDSTLNLSTAREDIRNLELSLEEKRIGKEQAQFEAPSVKRQAEIDYEKATRALAQAKSNYVTKKAQAIAKMREVGADVERQRSLMGVVQAVMAGYTIKAPSPGMVIYVKEWNGRKKTAGSQINPWDPTVATLPDLSEMESITYVNEVDVRKIAVGQPVVLSLDADPTKKLAGKVVSVANVGEQRPNADAKVFEVKVTVLQADTTLRPGMTTGNAVETAVVKDAVYVPVEAVFNEEGMTFVYRASGRDVVRREVATGAMNDNEIVITRGLAKDDRVLLSPPPNAAALDVERLAGSAAPKKDVVPSDTPAGARSVPAVPAVPKQP